MLFNFKPLPASRKIPKKFLMPPKGKRLGKRLFLCRHFPVLFCLLFSACTPTDYSPPAEPPGPPYFAPTIPSPLRNPTKPEGVALGRMLFYDPALSANGKISCATCHQQARAFTDGVARTNRGVSGKKLLRHAPALINLAWHNNGLFWEGGASDLESLTFGPLTHPDEMAMDLKKLIPLLKARRDYRQRFYHVFQTDTIHVALVARALAQFQRTLISENSEYDQFRRGERRLSAQAQSGMALFRKKCGSCHAGDFFTDHAFHNNGLDSHFPDTHEGIFQGRYRITLRPADMGKFKTPTLRNIMLTAPYMHDGRMSTINDVLDHYSQNIKESPTLDTLLRKPGGKIGIALTTSQKKQIIAFLETLTDSAFIRNPDFSDPFK